jgi:hypothetical protein
VRQFSTLKKRRSGAILGGKTARKIVVVRRISQLRKSVKFDTDRLRRKTIASLEQLFDVASDFARGRIKWQTQDGKASPVTIKQRQMWARIAAYVAQIMNTIANGIDERQIDKDLALLERLVNEATAKKEHPRSEQEPKENSATAGNSQGQS